MSFLQGCEERYAWVTCNGIWVAKWVSNKKKAALNAIFFTVFLLSLEQYQIEEQAV